MSLIKRSVFNGKKYLDLVSQGRTMVVDKLFFITTHNELISTNSEDLAKAGNVTVYGVPHHGEALVDNILVDSKYFNLPSVAGDPCATVISADGWSDNYEAIVVDINWEGSDGVKLISIGTEGYKFKSTKSLNVESENNT